MNIQHHYRRTYKSDLICPVCGTKTTIIRPATKRRPRGHLKTMYCAGCKDVRDLVEAGFHGELKGDT